MRQADHRLVGYVAHQFRCFSANPPLRH